MDIQNREQRRQAKFGGGRAKVQGGWPTGEPNPVFGDSEAPEEATAGRPDQDQTKQTGPGTGGATEHADDRMPEDKGTHGGISAKG